MKKKGNKELRAVLAKDPTPKITDPGAIHMMTTYHDDWCDFINGRGACNCEPEYSIVPIRRPGEEG